MNDNNTLADDLQVELEDERRSNLALMKLLADEKHKSERLEASLAKLDRETRGQTFQTPDENDARIEKLEAALQLIGNELSLHADQGPAGEAFRALLAPTLETKGDAK